MTPHAAKTVRLLVAEDNPLVRDLIQKGLDPHCEVIIAEDGADALLKVIDEPPDVILCDYKMPGLNGRQLFEKLRGREQTRHIPFLFMASRGDIEERLRPLIDGVEDFIAKPFLLKDLIRVTKKVLDRIHLEKLQKRASRPGVIQGRLEEMSMTDLLQSLEMGQKSCRLIVRKGPERGEMYFASGQCRDAKIGDLEGDEAVYKVILWAEGEFEIDFNAANASTRTTTTRNTTGLLMEAMRLMDEASREDSPVETQ
jgi:CheY-like chemotaxis protein